MGRGAVPLGVGLLDNLPYDEFFAFSYCGIRSILVYQFFLDSFLPPLSCVMRFRVMSD